MLFLFISNKILFAESINLQEEKISSARLRLILAGMYAFY